LTAWLMLLGAGGGGKGKIRARQRLKAPCPARLKDACQFNLTSVEVTCWVRGLAVKRMTAVTLVSGNWLVRSPLPEADCAPLPCAD
jgi:hypothetical protein